MKSSNAQRLTDASVFSQDAGSLAGSSSAAPPAPTRFLRLPKVMARTGLGRSAIYDGMERETFPKTVPLTKTAVGWIEADIEAWIAERIAARDAAGTQ